MTEEQDESLQEMNALMADVRFKTELENYIKFVFEQEYRMLVQFYPNHDKLVDKDL